MLKVPKKHPIHISEENHLLYFVNKGYVKRYIITQEGTESVQSIYGPGEVFPLTPVYKALFDETIYEGKEEIFYSAVSDCIVHSISREQLLKATEENPLIYKDLLYVAGLRLNSNIHMLENSSLKSATREVAELIVYFANRYGVEIGGGIEIQLPLTHELIGSVVNLTRETVTNSLKRLVELGCIKTGRNVVVTDMTILERQIH